MSVSSKNSISSSGFISDERTEDGLLKIHGVALGDNDITRGAKSGERKIWRPEVLQESGSFLEGKDIVVDHENQSARETIGRVTDAKYQEGTGIIYQGVVQDDELEPKIKHGWLDVSPKLVHSSEMEDVAGVQAPTEIYDFPNLSVVRQGASPSNELKAGESDELSVEELQSAFESPDGVEEYQFTEEGKTEELANPEVDYAQWLYDNPQGAVGASEKFPCGGIHQHDINGKTWYMPCQSHDDFLKSYSQVNNEDLGEHQEELAEYNEGDFVTWDNGSAHGKIVDWTDNGTYDASIDGDVSVEGTEEEPAALIQIYQESEDGWRPTDTMVGHKFGTLNEWNPDNVVEENMQIEHLQISESRTPTYSGTETSSWADIDKTLEEFVSGVSGDTSDVNFVDDLSQEQKTEIAEHTLLGDAEAETFDELLYFPVVNPNNGNLNRGALEAVRGGRGQSADIPQSTLQSAFSMAGSLLNEEFDADVEEEMMVASIKNAVETVELESHEEDLDKVYSEWSDTVNMTASQLRSWSGNACSREASKDPEAVIKRNLNLLETSKSEWGEDEVKDANRTISFINRMRGARGEGEQKTSGSFGCPSKWAISLLNWAYNPFDSVPSEPDNDGLGDVEEMAKHSKEMSKEERRVASMLSSHSEMTKKEAMGLISSANPNRENDISSMAKMVSSSLGVHQEEMRQLMERMAKHEDEMSKEDMRDMLQRHISENKSKLNEVFN